MSIETNPPFFRSLRFRYGVGLLFFLAVAWFFLWEEHSVHIMGIPASVAGAAPDYDRAVLKLAKTPVGIQSLSLGTSSDLKIGQSVFAIGNPFGLSRSLSTGIVIAQVAPGGSAEAAGLVGIHRKTGSLGDIIVKAEG